MKIDPVNPHASPEARDLLGYLYAIKGKQILSAQHDFISSETGYCEQIEKLTGVLPAIWGSDLSFFFTGTNPEPGKHCGPMNLVDPGLAVTASDLQFAARDMTAAIPQRLPSRTPDQMIVTGITMDGMRQALIERIKTQHKKGFIITLMWHALQPGKGDRGPYEDLWMPGGLPAEQWKELITPGSALHRKWQADVDAVAFYLRQLRDARIPVLWRPYHEMNGVWFWWGNHPGPDGYPRLWKMLYERLTAHHGLNNLLWVWNAHAPRRRKNDEAWSYAGFYPGAEYVDVLAADVYRRDYQPSHYNDLIKLADGRPVALAETGELPSGEILDRQPGWVWVMPWGHLGCLFNTGDEIRSFYSRKNVIYKIKGD